MGVRDYLTIMLSKRLLEYTRFMTCRPSWEKVKNIEIPEMPNVKETVSPLSVMMTWGFSLERNTRDNFVYSELKKPIKVSEISNLMDWMFLSDLCDTLPSPRHRDLFPNCDVGDNIVFEVWCPRIPYLIGEKYLRNTISFSVPEHVYVQSYYEMVDSIKSVVSGSSETRIYVLSKFAQPGYLGRFLEEIGSIPDVKLFLAVEEPNLSKTIKGKLKEYDNVHVVSTRSHRKLILVIYKDEFGEWNVLGYRGSLNLFYPGVDDYMEAVNDFHDLQRLLHGLIRAFVLL